MEKRAIQKILVFQERGSGEDKITGIREYGAGKFDLEVISINAKLPKVVDDPGTFLPSMIDADLVLDFLKHPDLSYELAVRCSRTSISVVASGKKWRVKGVVTIPT